MPEPELLPELIHHIQSFLSYKEAAVSTSLLSKVWLHAWSTIPNLNFHQSSFGIPRIRDNTHEELWLKFVKLVDDTVTRYSRDNIAIEKFDLEIGIRNNECASLVSRWLQLVGSKRCLKELSLVVMMKYSVSLSLPAEIFSSSMLKRVRIEGGGNSMLMIDPVIKSYSLVGLSLHFVHINESVVQKLLSTCRLLETVYFHLCTGFNRIQVKNLHCLRRLAIFSEERVTLEIVDTPNLRTLGSYIDEQVKHCLFNSDALQRLTRLGLLGGCESMDQSLLFDMLRSKFPCLETLIIKVSAAAMRWKTIKFTHAFLKSLRLLIDDSKELSDVVIHAPILRKFYYHGTMVPNIVFAGNISLQLVCVLRLKFPDPLDKFFFSRLCEALGISSKVEIRISINNRFTKLPSKIELDELRIHASPSKNVEKLSLKICSSGLEDNSALVDAIFSVCRPRYLYAKRDNFCAFVLRELMDRRKASCCVSHDQIKCWRHYLKNVEAFVDDKCDLQQITNSWESFLETSREHGQVPRLKFTLDWGDQADVGDFV